METDSFFGSDGVRKFTLWNVHEMVNEFSTDILDNTFKTFPVPEQSQLFLYRFFLVMQLVRLYCVLHVQLPFCNRLTDHHPLNETSKQHCKKEIARYFPVFYCSPECFLWIIAWQLLPLGKRTNGRSTERTRSLEESASETPVHVGIRSKLHLPSPRNFRLPRLQSNESTQRTSTHWRARLFAFRVSWNKRATMRLALDNAKNAWRINRIGPREGNDSGSDVSN